MNRPEQRSEAVLAAGDLPPLLGVPCPIKDLTMVAGVPIGSGSAALAGTVARSTTV